jgi:hypothetical protein
MIAFDFRHPGPAIFYLTWHISALSGVAVIVSHAVEAA